MAEKEQKPDRKPMELDISPKTAEIYKKIIVASAILGAPIVAIDYVLGKITGRDKSNTGDSPSTPSS